MAWHCFSLGLTHPALSLAGFRVEKTISKVPSVFVTGVRDVVGLSRRMLVAVQLRSNPTLKLVASNTLGVACRSVDEHHAVTP